MRAVSHWLCVTCALWSRGRLRDNYRFGKSGSISKNSVYQHYLDECRGRGLETDINQTYFGKLVKKAFAGIQYNRFDPPRTSNGRALLAPYEIPYTQRCVNDTHMRQGSS